MKGAHLEHSTSIGQSSNLHVHSLESVSNNCMAFLSNAQKVVLDGCNRTSKQNLCRMAISYIENQTSQEQSASQACE